MERYFLGPAIGRKILFIDFDGVLHPTSASGAQLFCRMPLLQEALGNQSCDIVISSSWRHHQGVKQLLEHFPLVVRSRIVGSTGEPHIGKWPRYQEIQNYLVAHGCASWRALDDSFIEFPKLCPELLLCNPNIGLDAAQMVALGRWLRLAE